MAPVEFEPDGPVRRGRSNSWLIATLVILVSICLIGTVLVGVVLFPVMRDARHVAQRRRAQTNMASVAVGLTMYAGDHDDRLPLADNWMDSTIAYVGTKRDFHAPALPRLQYGIALRKSLAGKPLTTIKDINLTALVFDSTLHEWNASGQLSTLPKPPRYGNGTAGGNVVGFANGTARIVAADEQGSLK